MPATSSNAAKSFDGRLSMISFNLSINSFDNLVCVNIVGNSELDSVDEYFRFLCFILLSGLYLKSILTEVSLSLGLYNLIDTVFYKQILEILII